MNVLLKKLLTPLKAPETFDQALEAKSPNVLNTPLTALFAPPKAPLKKLPTALNTPEILDQALEAKLPMALKTFATTFLTPLNIPA